MVHSLNNDNICLCLLLVISFPLSYCAGFSMPLCRHSIAFTICLRDRQRPTSCFEQVVPGDVHCCVLIVCLSCFLHCIASKFQVLRIAQPCISLLPRILLVTMRNAEERERTTSSLAAGPVWVL